MYRKNAELNFPKRTWIPECYHALSIGDFLTNKDDIKPTRTILPPGVFLWGRSLVEFSSVTYHYKLPKDDCEMASLSDLTGSLDVKLEPKYLDSEKRFALKVGMRLHSAIIIYRQKTSEIWLSDYYIEPLIRHFDED